MTALRFAALSLVLATPAAAAPDATLPAATVAVQAVTPTPDGRARISECTGALIAPDIVLTAGHCLDGVDRPARVAVFGYDGASPRAPHVAVIRYARHPDHVPGWRDKPGDPASRGREIAADLALLRLANPIPGATPATLAGDPYAAAGPARLTGTGRSGTGAGAKSGQMKRMQASAVRLSSGLAARVAFASTDRPACVGDSGGPVARATAGGELWGVVAAILQSKGGCGSRVVIAPVDAASPGFLAMRRALD